MPRRSARMLGAILLALGGAAVAGGAETARAARVALSFDDLPAHSALPPGMSRVDVARSILATLGARHAPPSYGFVNAKSLLDRPENAEVLRLWRAAGHPLANHTFSHIDLHASSAEAFEQDVIANEATLREFMGERDWHWLRFPYLRAGDSVEKRNAVAAFLKQRGYRVAEVTLSFDDYAYNEPYARCLAKNDSAGVEELKRSYLERARSSLSAGQATARLIYGRDIAHVMLLHIGAFQTVMLPKLLDLLQERGFALVTLDEAQRDPAYAGAPGLPTPSGATLLEQMLAARKPPAPARADDALAWISEICR